VVRRARTPGAAVSYAGTDIGRGETVLFAGTRLSSRETGVLAAIGRARSQSCAGRASRSSRRATRSSRPGAEMRPGLVYDSNGRILADAVREIGGEPEFLGVYADDLAAVRARLATALARSDLVLLSGGTSKGEGI
jgi:putative molybdopterin biosynthesis protein